jgi:methionyl aminopeptidase
MTFNSERDIEGLRNAGRIAAKVLREVVSLIKPGISVLKLDDKAGEIIQKAGAHAAPKMFENFPGHTCISVNEIIAHGIPTKKILRCGDRVNIDVSVSYEGYFGDVAYSIVLGDYNIELDKLCRTAKEITMKAIELSKAGTPINEIARVMENQARQKDYTIIKNLCSHGVGKQLHAHPSNIFNYYDPSQNFCLEPGMVIAWEPYVSDGACRAIESGCDNWSLTTHNQSQVAQFEHTVLVTEDAPEILTLLD